MRNRTTQPPATRPLAILIALCLTLTALSGCGKSSETIAHIEGSKLAISRPMLNHWMRAMSGGDFYAAIGGRAPLGLVAEPANYPECEAAARKVLPRATTRRPKPTNAQIATKCRQLYRSIKAQAVSFLTNVQITTAEASELGIVVTDAELHREFARARKQIYPTEAALHKYLEERRWQLSDILYQLKRNIIVTRLLPKFEAKVKQAGGGEATYTKLALERYKRRIARTSCNAGYLAPGCKQYHGPESVSPAPAVLLEELARK